MSHARDRSSLMEVRANAFAASFLMPAEGVRGYVNALSKGLGSRTRADTFDEEAVTRVEGRKRVDTQNIELHDVVRMAHHFGVSCTAMLYRLKGLDFVTEDERSSLAAQDSAGLAKALRGFLGLPEPVDSDGEMRVHARFVAMAIEAFTRGKITQRKLDELGSLVQVSDLSQRLRRAGLGVWPWPRRGPMSIRRSSGRGLATVALDASVLINIEGCSGGSRANGSENLVF